MWTILVVQFYVKLNMLATSMLMTEVGDEIFWRQLLKVGDCFKLYPLFLNTSQAYLDLEDVTNIKSPTSM